MHISYRGFKTLGLTGADTGVFFLTLPVGGHRVGRDPPPEIQQHYCYYATEDMVNLIKNLLNC